jgi:hypothetical protein
MRAKPVLSWAGDVAVNPPSHATAARDAGDATSAEAPPTHQVQPRRVQDRSGCEGGGRRARGWCSTATASSTASADAMNANPGRVTVHCWSSVRSRVEFCVPPPPGK